MGFLIGFFIRNGLASRRTIWLGLLSLTPVGFAVLIRLIAPVLMEEGVTPFALYSDFGLALFLHFLVPLMALFVGAGVITDEVDERTLPYLLTRPIPRRNIVLAKVCAAAITITVLLAVSHLLTFLVLASDPQSGGVATHLGQLLQVSGVILLGVAAYLGIFTFAGGVMKRPVIIGILFVFGWENTVAFFPGNVKLFTVAHYLHIIYPGMGAGDDADSLTAMLNQIIPAREVSDIRALLTLVAIAVIFTAAASTLLYFKEYRLEQGD